MEKIMNGKELSSKVKEKIKMEIEQLKDEGKRIPKLVVIIVGEDPASKTYVRNKDNACKYTGMLSEIIRYEEDVTDDMLLNKIYELNNDETVDGILVQLPLPQHIDKEKVLDAIIPEKDVDGFHPINVGNMFLGKGSLVPCTPKGVMKLLEEYKVELCGKHVVMVGCSNIVGKPLAMLALQENATVTLCNKFTENIKDICKTADILITAIGVAKHINEEYISDNIVVVDVGINRDENGKLCGDVDFNNVYDKVSLITPVPGGVGPMTIAMLLENTMKSYKKRE